MGEKEGQGRPEDDRTDMKTIQDLGEKTVQLRNSAMRQGAEADVSYFPARRLS
jgi:hypothetical protein